jgi:hypothetical protein
VEQIVDNKDYLISNDGDIYSLKSNKYIKSQIGNHGYKTIKLYSNNNPKRFLVHRLVALTYLPNTCNKKEVNHINGNKQDNRIENLEWVNPVENTRHAIENNLMGRGKSKFVLDLQTGIFYDSAKELSNILGIEEHTFRARVNSKNQIKYKYV